MNNSVLPQNSLIRATIGKNVTKKNINRWHKKNTTIYNKYMKNIKNLYSSFASTAANNNASTVVSSENESVYSEPSTTNNNSGGEFSKLIRRYKTQGNNSSFGSFATRALKKSRRSGGSASRGQTLRVKRRVVRKRRSMKK